MQYLLIILLLLVGDMCYGFYYSGHESFISDNKIFVVNKGVDISEDTYDYLFDKKRNSKNSDYRHIGYNSYEITDTTIIDIPKKIQEKINIKIPEIPNKISYIMSGEHTNKFSDSIKIKLDEDFSKYREIILQDLSYDDSIKSVKYIETTYKNWEECDEGCISRMLARYYDPGYEELLYAEQSCCVIKSKKYEKPKNKSISIGEQVITKRPVWEEVISYYGGLAKLASKRINGQIISKDIHLDQGYFDLNLYVDKIVLKDSSKCSILMYYEGNQEQLLFHNILESKFEIDAYYRVSPNSSDSLSIYDIYNYEIKNPKIIIDIPKNDYFPNGKKYIYPITSSLFESYGAVIDRHIPSINYIINEIVSDAIFLNFDSIKQIEKQKNLAIETQSVGQYELNKLISETETKSIKEFKKKIKRASRITKRKKNWWIYTYFLALGIYFASNPDGVE